MSVYHLCSLYFACVISCHLPVRCDSLWENVVELLSIESRLCSDSVSGKSMFEISPLLASSSRGQIWLTKAVASGSSCVFALNLLAILPYSLLLECSLKYSKMSLRSCSVVSKGSWSNASLIPEHWSPYNKHTHISSCKLATAVHISSQLMMVDRI